MEIALVFSRIHPREIRRTVNPKWSFVNVRAVCRTTSSSRSVRCSKPPESVPTPSRQVRTRIRVRTRCAAWPRSRSPSGSARAPIHASLNECQVVMRVLLIEDDLHTGQSLHRALKDAGYSVDWVRDGEADAVQSAPLTTRSSCLGSTCRARAALTCCG